VHKNRRSLSCAAACPCSAPSHISQPLTQDPTDRQVARVSSLPSTYLRYSPPPHSLCVRRPMHSAAFAPGAERRVRDYRHDRHSL